MRLEISNPSDKATIDCSNLIAAHLAVLLLSHGKYGIIDPDGINGMPIFIFSGHDEFFQSKHGMNVEKALSSVPHSEIARALESIDLCGEGSSINNFSGRAKEMAKQLRSMC
jgi:hypothetical protein